jgi:hypothetical protein
VRTWVIANIKRGLARYGYELNRIQPAPAGVRESTDSYPDFDEAAHATVTAVQGYTMTSPERIFALREAVRHVVAHGIPGSFVECGVWRGGSMMVVARTLLELGVTDRDLYLFDTFEGMPAPTVHDVDLDGVSAYDRWNSQRRNRFVPAEASAGLDEVREAMDRVGYPVERIHYVQGLVEDTVPDRAPAQIAVLRLDTDYYESTRHELFELYPRLTHGGILIVDDYGHFQGAKLAVNEFLSQCGEPVLLHRVDYAGRVAVRP